MIKFFGRRERVKYNLDSFLKNGPISASFLFIFAPPTIHNFFNKLMKA